MYHYLKQINYIETIKNGKYWSKVLLKTVLTDMGHQKFLNGYSITSIPMERHWNTVYLTLIAI